MTNIKLAIAALTIVLATLSSCGKYDKLLKSNDNELKYKEAKAYYESGHYLKAYSLLENVAGYYKGTKESHEVLFLIAESYRKNEDYLVANNYYKTYVKSFPTGSHYEESWFRAGEVLYELSPDPKLDQTETYAALEELEEYTQLFPGGQFSGRADSLITELRTKLATKAYLSAKLYYNLGNYLGNNYQAAVITAQNALKDYPETVLKDDFMYLILRSKYDLARKSVTSKKVDRYTDVIDEYYNYSGEFPQGKHIKDAVHMRENADKYISSKEENKKDRIKD